MRLSTHEVADMLNALSRVLKRMPDMPLSELGQVDSRSSDRRPSTKSERASALLSLVAFSKFSKREWAELIYELDLPIYVSPSYSARDLMGKICNALEEDPLIRRRLMSAARAGGSGISNDLLKTLSALVGDRNAP